MTNTEISTIVVNIQDVREVSPPTMMQLILAIVTSLSPDIWFPALSRDGLLALNYAPVF